MHITDSPINLIIGQPKSSLPNKRKTLVLTENSPRISKIHLFHENISILAVHIQKKLCAICTALFPRPTGIFVVLLCCCVVVQLIFNYEKKNSQTKKKKSGTVFFHGMILHCIFFFSLRNFAFNSYYSAQPYNVQYEWSSS